MESSPAADGGPAMWRARPAGRPAAGPDSSSQDLQELLLSAYDPEVPARAAALRTLSRLVEQRDPKALAARKQLLQVGCLRPGLAWPSLASPAPSRIAPTPARPCGVGPVRLAPALFWASLLGSKSWPSQWGLLPGEAWVGWLPRWPEGPEERAAVAAASCALTLHLSASRFLWRTWSTRTPSCSCRRFRVSGQLLAVGSEVCQG